MTSATSVIYCLVYEYHGPENGAEKCDHCARGECDPSLFIFPGLGYAHYSGMGESVFASSILNQTASYLAHTVAKSCTLIVIHTEFTADQYTYIIIVVPCSTLWHGKKKVTPLGRGLRRLGG